MTDQTLTQPADAAASLDLPERLHATLTRVVRKALLAEQFGATDMKTERVVTDVLAELCPTNHLLLTLEVERSCDPGYDTPYGYEPPHDYAVLINPTIAHHSVTDDQTAGLLTFSAEDAELLPDGLNDLNREVCKVFASQQSELIRKAEERRSNPLPELTFPAVPPATTTDRADRSPS